jgi:hypothetical protein
MRTITLPVALLVPILLLSAAAGAMVELAIVAFPPPRAAAQCPDLASVRSSQEDLNHARVELESHTALLTQIRDALRKR